MNDWSFVTADDDELNGFMSGSGTRGGYPWPSRSSRRLNFDREVGVLVQVSGFEHGVRPGALVVSEDAGRRLFGRYAQLRSDLSPISAWTHILDPDQFEQTHEEARVPDLAGFETSWIGLSVAEALMLSDRPLSQLKLVACLATPTFALARAHALWPRETIEGVLRRYDLCQKLVRANDGAANRLREPLSDIWKALLAVSVPLPRDLPSELRWVTQGLVALRSARHSETNEARALFDVFDDPRVGFLRHLDDMPPEVRVREFDRLVDVINDLSANDRPARNMLLFVAGYLATVVAGGSPSLGLAETAARRWPQIAAWAYVLGGVGETVTWTSSFDGLGRLVARELLRPFRLDEPPTTDFALAEAAVLVDRALSDPLVHLRIKQSRVLSVALLPGVNVAVPIAEASQSETRPAPVTEPVRSAPSRTSNDGWATIAEHVLPYLAEHFAPKTPPVKPVTDTSKRSSRSRGAKRDAQLPLDVDRPKAR